MNLDDFLATARGRMLQLDALHDAGSLDDAVYQKERRAIEKEVSERLLEAKRPDSGVRPSGRLVAALGVAVLAIAVAGYWATGSPELLRTGPDTVSADGAAVAGHESGASGVQQIAAMVDKLAARMKERPDDVEGWTMLARSYTVLGRFGEALPAYRRASELQPKNASLLADYADAVAATKGSANNPESQLLIERALSIEPAHPKALALAGSADYDRGDYAAAIARWQKVVDALPPDSELGKQMLASIAEAREHAAPGGQAPASAAPAIAAAPQAPTAPAAAATAQAVSGTVTLDAAVAAKASPDDTVFVFARAAEGSRMPLAVKRAKVADLPLSFRLDDSMAMSPTATLSSARRLVVGARISKSGTAISQPGDLSGEVSGVAPGATGLAIRIDRVVGSSP
ncbi:MAG: c-type cytochrome biogenesis protein CcmI/CycH [Caldimonas sp.]